MMGLLPLYVAAFLCSAVLTGLVRRRAIGRGQFDLPNARSSHTRATPRGGGLAIVLTVSSALPVLAWQGVLTLPQLWALLGGGTAVAVVGFADDRRAVAPGLRLAVHVLAALWAVWWLGGLASVSIEGHVVQLGWVGDVLAVTGIVWVLNLFNFMDGIDGIAAGEAVFVTGAAAALGWSDAGGVAAAALVVAAASLGFLLWNWAPARIFMGDVGSGYLGFAIATLSLGAAREQSGAVWVWLVLGGVFFVDATLTLVRRALAGQHVHQAHRSHAYQQLARRWHSHARVTLGVLSINLLWLLPCALLATRWPQHALLIAVLALAPLVLLAVLAGAGQREPEDERL
jgi:Fuc2NAc and GlcNAc transferase